MRAFFQRSIDVSYLFAISIEHLMRDLFTPTHRAFTQFGSFYQLRPIGPDDWTKELRERFAADDCTVDETALARLSELGERTPAGDDADRAADAPRAE